MWNENASLEFDTVRTDEEIVEQTNQLAIDLIALVGYVYPDIVEMWRHREHAGNSRQRLAWDLACAAQIALTNTDPNDALVNLGWK